MSKKTFTAEQIIVHLREVEVLCSQGKTIADASRSIGVSEQTYYRWRKQYGGMNSSDASASQKYGLSQRRACRALSICRSSIRYIPVKREDEDEITTRIIELSCNYGRYGYRRITAMLRKDYVINHKRVERIWREQGLKVPKKQPKKRRLWLNDGSCVRLRPEYQNHVWSYDFVEDRLRNGRKVRWLNIIDEYTRECLASIPKRKWRHEDIIELVLRCRCTGFLYVHAIALIQAECLTYGKKMHRHGAYIRGISYFLTIMV